MKLNDSEYSGDEADGSQFTIDSKEKLISKKETQLD